MKQEQPNLVRQDINFLEFPIWTLKNDPSESEFAITTENGVYHYKANKDIGVPDSNDYLILHYILYLTQKSKSRTVSFTFYDACKSLRFSVGGREYKRIHNGLKKWSGVVMFFDGCFYEGSEKIISSSFQVLKYKIKEIEDDVKNKPKKKIISVTVDEDFYNKAINSNFYRNIDINILIDLKDPLARRVHEYLEKQFVDRYKIKREALKLFEKLRVKCDPYPSIIKRRLVSVENAIGKVNKYHPSYRYTSSYYVNVSGEFILEIDRHKKVSKHQQSIPLPDKNKERIIEALKNLGFFKDLIEKTMQEHSLEVLEDALKDFEINRVKKLKEGVEIEGGYFNKMLPHPGEKHNFSKAYRDHLKDIENKKMEQREKAEKKKKEEEENRLEIARKKLRLAFLKLPKNKRTKVTKEATKFAEEQLKDSRGYTKEHLMRVKIREKEEEIIKKQYQSNVDAIEDDTIDVLTRKIKELEQKEKEVENQRVHVQIKPKMSENQAREEAASYFKDWYKKNKTHMSKATFDRMVDQRVKLIMEGKV